MRAAEKFIEDSAAGVDEDEEDGYRTQSTSSVSDHTDAESDSDTNGGEDRSEQAEAAVRKNIQRPPRLPYGRNSPFRPPAPCLTKAGTDKK